MAIGIRCVDNLQGFYDFFNRFDARVGPTALLLLTIVSIDVAKLALLLAAEVLTDSENGQVEQIPPLNGRSDIDDWFPITQSPLVVFRSFLKLDSGHLLLFQLQDGLSLIADGDLIRGMRIESHGNNDSAKVSLTIHQTDLLGCTQILPVLHILDGNQVEGKNKVGFGLKARSDSQSIFRKGDSLCEQILLKNCLGRQIRVFLN